MSKSLGVFAGSFDPFTKGHSSVVNMALDVFDRILIVIAHNSNKKTLFTPARRADMICSIIDDEFPKGRVSVSVLSSILIADYAFEANASLIRGVRTNSDFEYEMQMSIINKRIRPSVQTVIFPAHDDMTGVSSSTIKQMLNFFGWEGAVRPYVHPVVLEALKKESSL